MRLSMLSQYDFKTDYCRKCISNLYQFNGFTSFIDTLNGDVYNGDKMSWKSWYYMYCDGDEKMYISKQQIMW